MMAKALCARQQAPGPLSSVVMEPKAAVPKSTVASLPPAILTLVTLALMARLFLMVDEHAVNLPYYDQLDFYEIFKTDASPWEVFRYQHGPHRQGLPFLGTQLLAALTDWNIRADAFYVAAYVFAATGLALLLRRRLQGSSSLSDVIIPLLLLTPAQYGIFIHTPNASHGAGPLFLLILYCLTLTHKDRMARYAALVFLNFVMLHTGFAFFVGGITPMLLAIFTYQDARAGGWKPARLPAGAFLVSLLSVAVFFWNYTEKQGLDQVRGTEDWMLYPKYLAALFANVLGLKNTTGAEPSLALAAGTAAGIAVLAVAIWSLSDLLKASPCDAAAREMAVDPGPEQHAEGLPRHALASVCFTLTLFTLLYGIATAIGRVHLGLSGAQSTRYVPLVVPAFLGLYFATPAIRSKKARQSLTALMVVALVAATFPMREAESRFMHRLSASKRTWIATYLKRNDIRAADRAARLRVYPFVGPKFHTAEKFEYMRQHRLSFFAASETAVEGQKEEK